MLNFQVQYMCMYIIFKYCCVGLNLGIRSDGDRVNDVVLPPWAKSMYSLYCPIFIVLLLLLSLPPPLQMLRISLVSVLML